MDVRKRKKQMELLWRGSESLGDTAELFTGNFASGNYGPPPGFNWDWGQADPQMQVLCRVRRLSAPSKRVHWATWAAADIQQHMLCHVASRVCQAWH